MKLEVSMDCEVGARANIPSSLQKCPRDLAHSLPQLSAGTEKLTRSQQKYSHSPDAPCGDRIVCAGTTYKCFHDSISCVSCARRSRIRPNWRSGWVHLTIQKQPSCHRLCIKRPSPGESQMKSTYEANTRGKDSLPTSYPKTRFRAERACA